MCRINLYTCSREFTHVLRNEDDAASWSSSRFFGKLKMDSRMLYFRCYFNVLVVYDCFFVFLDGLSCSKLDCLDIILRLTRVGCGFMSKICCLLF
ncbi:hypothetical protein HanHA300_Chr02g0049641 [Helianthus annuus]|nr:hypothetical protein HanHA300_Chr02g0049641 [Helianthus annuus]